MEFSMPFKIMRSKNFPIGIDLGSSGLRLAQLRLSPEDKFELTGAASVKIPSEVRDDPSLRMSFFAEALRNEVKTDTFKGQEAILSLPSEETFIHHLKLSLSNPEQMEAAVRSELRSKLPFAVDDAVVRYVVAGAIQGDPDDRQEIIAVAAKRSTLESYLAMSRKAKLDVSGINIGACAVVECFARLFRRSADINRTILFLDIGDRNTQVVFSHGAHIVFARNIEFGGTTLDKTLSERMGTTVSEAHQLRHLLMKSQVDQDEADKAYRILDIPLDHMINELSTCLRYYESVFRGRTVERVIFVGSQAYDKHLCQTIAQRMNLAAQIGDPLLNLMRQEGARISEDLDQEGPRPDWAVAIGLSLGSGKVA